MDNDAQNWILIVEIVYNYETWVDVGMASMLKINLVGVEGLKMKADLVEKQGLDRCMSNNSDQVAQEESKKVDLGEFEMNMRIAEMDNPPEKMNS